MLIQLSVNVFSASCAWINTAEQNGDFETGVLLPEWTGGFQSINAIVVHTGNYSGFMTYCTTGSLVYTFSTPIESNLITNATVWFYHTSTSTGTHHVRVTYNDTSYSDTYGDWGVKSVWSEFTLNPLTPNLKVVSVLFHCSAGPSSGLYVDDFFFGYYEPEPTPTPTPEPWYYDIPFSILLGLVALFMVFGGPIWMIHSTREHDFKQSVNGLIILIVGLALIVGWFWP